MATVVLDDEPVIAAWLERRGALGQDGRDEVWEGDHHVAPHGHARNGDIAMQLVVLLHGRARAAGFRIWQRDDEAYGESGRSDLLGLAADQVASDVDWP